MSIEIKSRQERAIWAKRSRLMDKLNDPHVVRKYKKKGKIEKWERKVAHLHNSCVEAIRNLNAQRYQEEMEQKQMQQEETIYTDVSRVSTLLFNT